MWPSSTPLLGQSYTVNHSTHHGNEPTIPVPNLKYEMNGREGQDHIPTPWPSLPSPNLNLETNRSSHQSPSAVLHSEGQSDSVTRHQWLRDFSNSENYFNNRILQPSSTALTGQHNGPIIIPSPNLNLKRNGNSHQTPNTGEGQDRIPAPRSPSPNLNLETNRNSHQSPSAVIPSEGQSDSLTRHQRPRAPSPNLTLERNSNSHQSPSALLHSEGQSDSLTRHRTIVSSPNLNLERNRNSHQSPSAVLHSEGQSNALRLRSVFSMARQEDDEVSASENVLPKPLESVTNSKVQISFMDLAWSYKHVFFYLLFIYISFKYLTSWQCTKYENELNY